MEKQPNRDSEPTANRPDFRRNLRSDIQKFTPTLEIPETNFEFIIDTLNLMHDKYGDINTEDYLLYHNDIHAYDVVSRTLKLGGLFQECAPGKIDDHSLILAATAAAGHDIIQKECSGTVTDEILSAEYMQQWAVERGFTEDDAKRIGECIIATTAEKNANGVTQTRVREGEANPIKLLVAMADIQGTTMEGKNRMITDVARLYFEINPPAVHTPVEHIDGLSKFLLNQLNFISDRLDSIPGDLRYYFPEEIAKKIEDCNKREFRTHGLSVIHTAKNIEMAATQLADTLHLYIDTIPDTPLQASRLARRALSKVVKKLSRQ